MHNTDKINQLKGKRQLARKLCLWSDLVAIIFCIVSMSLGNEKDMWYFVAWVFLTVGIASMGYSHLVQKQVNALQLEENKNWRW